MSLAAPDEKGQQRAVLISITQNIGGYAGDFLYLLNKFWKEVSISQLSTIPQFFQPPSEPSRRDI